MGALLSRCPAVCAEGKRFTMNVLYQRHICWGAEVILVVIQYWLLSLSFAGCRCFPPMFS